MCKHRNVLRFYFIIPT